MLSKKTEYDKLVKKGDNIDTTGFVLKTSYNTDKSDLEKKISDADRKMSNTNDPAKKTDLNPKTAERESKIPNITGLAPNSALTAVENKIPDVSNLVKKTNCDTKIREIENKVNDHNHDKYITTPKFNALAVRVFNARSARVNLITKADFNTELKKISDGVASNKSKHLLVETEFKKLEIFDAGYFKGKNYFDDDGTQNYLVFQPVYKYFDAVGFEIASWKPKGLFNEEISSVINSDGSVPKIVYDNVRIKVKFNGNLLKRNKVTCNHGPIVNIYNVYRLIPATKDSSVTLQNCLFGAVKLTKKMLILINTNILDMVLDFVQEEVLHIQVEDTVEMLLSLELI